MGKWLNQLREREKGPPDRTDKTDKTGPSMVLSVSSGQSDGLSKIVSAHKGTASSVSFVSSPPDPLQVFRPLDNWSAWDDEDWQAAFDERAAILEFDQDLPRQEAESLACRQIEAERKRWIQ